jgi:arsenate reductase
MTRDNVLFLCTGNSARSIMAEALLNHLGADRFRAFSAGSAPTGAVNPLAIATLQRHGIGTDHLSSKSWEAFARADSPPMRFMFTVCDKAAQEACPIWPGRRASGHWSVEDPAAVKGTDAEKAAAFEHAFRDLEMRIRRFVATDWRTSRNAAG